MNYLSDNFTTLEQGLKALKEGIEARNKMGSNAFYNAFNEECISLANKLIKLGADRTEISALLGPGTHY